MFNMGNYISHIRKIYEKILIFLNLNKIRKPYSINENFKISSDIADIFNKILGKHNLLKGSIYQMKEQFWEIFAMNLLNCIYNLELRRIEEEETNADVIDLYDYDNSICFQVTTELTSKKISNTINKFEKKELYKQFNKLKFFLITDKIPFPKVAFKSSFFTFNKKQDIITFSTIVLTLNSKELPILEKVRTILETYHKEVENKAIQDSRYKEREAIAKYEKEKEINQKLMKTIEYHAPNEMDKIKQNGLENYNPVGGIDPLGI